MSTTLEEEITEELRARCDLDFVNSISRDFDPYRRTKERINNLFWIEGDLLVARIEKRARLTLLWSREDEDFRSEILRVGMNLSPLG